MRPLTPADRELLAAPVLQVAPLLLGAVLRHRAPDGVVAVRLTEVEAYAGVGEDPGSHAHRGARPRTRSMFGPAGHLYAYFTYGMHVCINVVTGPPGRASAVLLRAGEVVEGVEHAARRRGGVRARAVSGRDLARGPANLASALGIALTDDGADLLGDPAFSLELTASADDHVEGGVVRGPRVGVSGEGGSDRYPWRFALAGEPTVSAYRPAAARRR